MSALNGSTPRRRAWRWRNIPVPEAHLGVGLVAVGMEVLRPLPLSRRRLRPVGWALAAAGAALTAWATRAAGDVDLEDPERLVSHGPYALMPHPMYRAWTMMYVGVGFVAGSGWTLGLTPVVVVLNRREVIREERLLATRFGPTYEAYRPRFARPVAVCCRPSSSGPVSM